jgi:hypothetical protein
MEKGSLLTVARHYDGWKTKAENYLCKQFPEMIDSGHFHGISVGRNQDGGVGDRGGYRVRGNPSVVAHALYLDVPKRMIGDNLLAHPDLKTKSIVTRASDAVQALAIEQINDLIGKGIEKNVAQQRVADSIASFGYYDKKSGTFVAERISGRTKDSVLGGMMTPYWDIARIQKVFKQPFLRGYSDNLVNKVGIPNIWADLVQIFTETFEGMARVSNVAKGTGEFNTTTGVKNRTGTMLSEIINLVIDYESPTPMDGIYGGMEGNWLTNAVIGDRDAYANLMLEQLTCLLYYFGHAESGFEGLTQIANRDGTYTFYDHLKPPASYMWDNDGAGGGTGTVNNTVGSDLLLMFNHLIADMMEELFFLPVDVKITCSPILYKALKFSMLSKNFNQNSPLSIISTAFESGNKIQGTMASISGDSLYRQFELVPDPMLMPNTDFNPTGEDLMFITFPTLQSAMDGGNLTDLIMAPVPIDKMVLPSAPGYRDGTARTALKRIGSLLCPVAKTVHVISGMGINSRYTPPV